ncbi:MAG TPA: response regulator [Myxococcota bacterium]|nr:response regulator [Myxococcota bacterium]
MEAADRLNILLVDDQPGKLLTYETILAELGENLLKATSAREALGHLLHSEIAIVVMDVSMPDVDGFELAAMIRQHPRCERTAIIFASAVHVSDLDRMKGYETGALDYLPVPIVPQMLRAKIRVLSDLHRKTRQLTRLNEELERRVGERTEALERTAERLRGSEARFRSLAEGMPHIVWEADPGGNVTYFSPRWRTYTGAEPSTHFGWGWLAVVDAEDRERARAAAIAAVESKGDVRLDFEARFRRHDGVYRWLHASGEAVLRADGSVEKWVGTCIDIDERKRAEQTLRETDRRKDEFLAMLAHELRNPLAPIHNALKLQRMPEADPALMNWSRDVIERQVGQLTRLVEDLLDISRITRGNIRLRVERVDLAAVIEGAVETSRPLIDGRNHMLAVKLPEERIELSGDLVRLTQVVANLLNNAAKFQDEGGAISVSAEREGKEAVIRVRDRGVGLSADSLEKIFELFAQVRTRERFDAGLGIGLSLVRTLVELHGGSVSARSDGPGCGSEFIVRLPCLAADAEPLASGARPRASRAVRDGLRVLVVDDNRDSADSLALLLRLRGHEPQACYDGTSALEAARTLQPHAVLLDLSMPDLDGFDVCRRLREEGLESALIVALTGYGQEADRNRSLASGFDAHLVKPVDPELVAKLLDERGASTRRPQ